MRKKILIGNNNFGKPKLKSIYEVFKSFAIDFFDFLNFNVRTAQAHFFQYTDYNMYGQLKN